MSAQAGPPHLPSTDAAPEAPRKVKRRSSARILAGLQVHEHLREWAAPDDRERDALEPLGSEATIR